MFLFILFQKTVYDLTFFESAMADSCQHSIPVTESVFFLDNLLILRLQNIRQINGFTLAVRSNQLLASYNVVFFEFPFKPLVDLILCLGTLDNVEPVPAGSLGILRRQNLNSVAVLYFIVNIDQFSVYSCPYHLIAHGAVKRVGKINRRGTVWQVLYISIRSKTVHIFREQIQIALEKT